MWNETVTLYIDDTSIRLLVSQGQKAKKWAETRLESGLIKDSLIIQEGEVALRIKNLLLGHQVKKRRVVIGFSGLHSLSRPATLPQLPPSMLPEAVAREARRVLPVPLDQLYLSWRQVPCPKGRTQVFLAATPRKTTDSVMKTLKMAGLEPDRASIKPLALTRALPVNDAVLIDLQPGEFDIAIIVDGIAQPIRTVSLPEEELSWDRKLNMITTDLDRTLKFYDTNNPEKPLDPTIPIYVSGAFIEKPELMQPLVDSTGHPVEMLSPNFKGLEQIDLSRYGVNVAMVVNPQSPGREATFPVANLNMLPAFYQPKPISMAKVVGIPSGVAVAGLMVPLVMLMQGNTANISTLQNQLDITNQMLTQKIQQQSALNTSIKDLTKKAAAVQTVSQGLNLTLQTLQAQQEYVNGDILATLGNLAPDITLDTISETINKLIITGSAPTESDVHAYAQTILSYARELDLTTRFIESTVSSLKISDAIEFTLTFDRGN